jgi:hypothetical protein
MQDDGRVSAQTWGLSGAVYGCPLSAQSAHFYGGACAYVEAGAVIANGVRALTPRTDTAWLLSTGARLRGGVRWSPWTLGLEVGGGGYLVRPRIAYEVPSGGSATLVEAWAGSLDVFLCVGVWLP